MAKQDEQFTEVDVPTETVVDPEHEAGRTTVRAPYNQAFVGSDPSHPVVTEHGVVTSKEVAEALVAEAAQYDVVLSIDEKGGE